LNISTGTGPIGIFGGTFDPIHYGHLRTAFELWQSLKLSEVRFPATGNPPHRERTLADAALRVAMVRAAVADQPPFVVDDREVRRAGASYTVDTLTELRAENPNARCACCSAWTLSSDCPTGTAGANFSIWRMWWSRIGPAGRPRCKVRWAS
jgi:nicotinate (nicotinamide) nucleotide adenylyltransferase